MIAHAKGNKAFLLAKARRDMNLSENVYKVGSIFIQNGDFYVTVGKFDAKTRERNSSNEPENIPRKGTKVGYVDLRKYCTSEFKNISVLDFGSPKLSHV